MTAVVFNPGDASPELEAALESNAAVVDESGVQLEQPKDVLSLLDVIARKVSSHYSKTPAFESLPAGDRGRIEVTVELEERLCVRVSDGARTLADAAVRGNLYWLEHHHPVRFRRLVDVKDGRRPIAGCGLAEMSTGELVCITTTNVENRGSVISIAAADRAKATIRRHRLR